MKKARKRWALILVCALMAGIFPVGTTLSALAEEGGELKDPAVVVSALKIVENDKMASGQEVMWDSVYFGSYPQAEVVDTEKSENYTEIDSTIRKAGDLIVDDNLYEELLTRPNSEWDANGEMRLDLQGAVLMPKRWVHYMQTEIRNMQVTLHGVCVRLEIVCLMLPMWATGGVSNQMASVPMGFLACVRYAM